MKSYYISHNNQKRGPYSYQELQYLNIHPDTLLCTDTDGWKPAADHRELRSLVAAKPFGAARVLHRREIMIVNNSSEDLDYALLKSFCMLLILLFFAQIVHTIGG